MERGDCAAAVAAAWQRQLGSGSLAWRRWQRGGDGSGRVVAAHSVMAVAAWLWRGGGGSLAAAAWRWCGGNGSAVAVLSAIAVAAWRRRGGSVSANHMLFLTLHCLN